MSTQETVINHEEEQNRIERSASFYRELFEAAEKGPQHEGISAEEVKEALLDPETIVLSTEFEGQSVDLPLFVPIRHNEWLSQRFLESRFGQERPMYYMSNIPGVFEDDALAELVAGSIDQLSEQGAVIITEHLEGNDDPIQRITGYLDTVGLAYNYDSLSEESDSPAGEWHYAVEPIPVEGQPESSMSLTEAYRQGVVSGKFPEVDLNGDGTTVLEAVEESDIDRLWELYKGPFEHLSSIHPIRGNFSYDEFKEAMSSKDVMKVVHLEQGEIVTFCFLQNNLDLCPWINKDLYKDKYPEQFEDGNILYFPGIVTDEAKRGHAYSESVISMLVDVAHESGDVPTIIYECTDLSRQYIPKIVERFINQSGKFECTTKYMGRHLYQAIEL